MGTVRLTMAQALVRFLAAQRTEQADTELSNLARGKVMGKRMVDQSDIDKLMADFE